MGRRHLTDEAIKAFRDEACEVALDLYATQQDVTLRQLASAMGCSQATPYRYFDNKEALFMAVRTRCFQRFSAHLEAHLDPIIDPLERLEALSHIYSNYAHASPTEFHLMFSLGQPRYEDYPWAQEAAQSCWSIVQHTAQRTIDAGQLIGDARTLAHMFWSATHGVVMLSLSERLRMGVDHLTLLPPLLDALITSHLPPSKDHS